MNDFVVSKQSDMVLQVVNRGGDRRWYTAMLMCENGSHQEAAKLVDEILCDPGADYYRSIIADWNYANKHTFPTKKIIDISDRRNTDSIMLHTVITAIGNTAAFKDDFNGNVVAMTKHAVDIGANILAYNVANAILIWAVKPSDFAEAQRYFKIVIDNCIDRSEKAAAIVNSAIIVRDGLVTGEENYEEAFNLYEQAGELGQVTGMFNAANISSLMIDKGKTKYIAHMEYWLQRLLERVGGGVPLLESDKHPGLDSMVNNARIILGQMHIFGKASDPKPIYGIILYRMVTSWGNYDPRRDYDIAYSHKIARLGRPANDSPLECWAYVLDAMDWRIGKISDIDNNMGVIDIHMDEDAGHVSMIVLNNLILGTELDETTLYFKEFIQKMKDRGFDRYLITQSVAMYYDNDGDIYTPVIAVSNGEPKMISIYPGMSTKDLMSAIENPPPFIDGMSFSSTAALPIAINQLQSGGSVIDGANDAVQTGKMGVWSIPHAPKLVA